MVPTMITAALVAPAASAEPPNHEPLVVVELVHQGGDDHRWGAQLGGEWLWALGDHCTWAEYPDCRTGTWWPVVGPRATLTWRGDDRIGVVVAAVAGPSAVDMHQAGFFPVFSALGTAGGQLELGQPAALLLGGSLTKSLSYTDRWEIPGGTASRTYGPEQLSLSFTAHARWAGAWRPIRWASGLEMATLAADLL